MIRRLVVTYLVVTAFALGLLAVPLGLTLSHHEKDRLLSDLEADADTMSSLVSFPIEAHQPVPSKDIFTYSRRDPPGHVIVVDKNGIALVDTDHPGERRAYGNRPEIRAALAGNRVHGSRYSNDAGTTLLYAAVPTSANGHVNGAVRVTFPTTTLDARVRRVWAQLALLCIGVLVVVAGVAYLLARSVTRPVRQLEEANDRLASGDHATRVDVRAGWPELRRLAETFNRMAGQIEWLVAAQRQFVADASHQLRTPLTALRLRLENLDAHVPEQQRPAINAAAAEVARMSRLVDGLLLLARDDTEITAVPVDVAHVIRERAAVWEEVFDERGVAIDVDAPPAAWALAVPGSVEQLLDNLVDNALAVSDRASHVVVRVERNDSAVALHVLDDGPGLSADARVRAFDRFWRGPDAAPGGSGLGLAIVRQLADASGGSARLEPRDGGGLDAVVVLRATTSGVLTSFLPASP